MNTKCRITISREEISLTCILFLLFTSCVLFSESEWSSILSLIGFGAYCIYLLKIDILYYIKYLAFIFIAFSAILGTTVIEFFNLYLVELQCESSYVGSLPLLILGYWCLLVSFRIFDTRKQIKNLSDSLKLNNSEIKILRIFVWGVCLIFLLMFLKVIKYPAFLLGIDRFAYSMYYQPSGIWSIISNISPLLLVFPILYFINGKRVISSITILLYFFYALWTGNKFGPFFTLICIFLLIYSNKLIEKGKKYIKRVTGLLVIIFTLLIAFTIYFSQMSSDFTSLEYISTRAAQQGQLWWKSYELSNGEIHSEEFDEEISSAFSQDNSVSNNIGADYGIYKMMYYCAPNKLVDFKLSTGSRYTEAGMALINYYFGPIGLILFSNFIGFIIVKTINGFINCLTKRDYIKALILLRFFMIERTFLTMFVLSDITDVISLLSYLYLLFMNNKMLVIKKKKLMLIRYKNKYGGVSK